MMAKESQGKRRNNEAARPGLSLWAEWSSRPWFPWAILVLASAMAHLWCLGSQFYLDDLWQIRDNEWILDGRILEPRLLQWTYVVYWVQYQLFGMSPVAFHAVNWLLHTAVACVLYAVGLQLFAGKASRMAVLFGAVLFVVHPLGSEIPNYARTQDLAWVTLFSLLACLFLLRFLRGGRWFWLLGVGAGALGATFSKGPGLFHVGMMVGVVVLGGMEPRHWKFLRRWAWYFLGGFLLLLLVAWLLGWLNPWIGGTHGWKKPRFSGHALTLCRVFWEFAWRAVIPLRQSADHQIAETVVSANGNIFDTTALWAAAGMVLWVLVSLLLMLRESARPYAVCSLLFVGAMVMRLLYFVTEFMPEYRIYPGLPWFCLGAGVFLARQWSGRTKRWALMSAVLLIMVFAGLSARRAFLWHDVHDLMGNVLEMYPGQSRSMWVMHRRDLEDGNWQRVIERQRRDVPVVSRNFHEANQRYRPGRRLLTGLHALSQVGCRGHYARAIAHVEGPEAGLREIARLEAWMRRLGMRPDIHKIDWIFFYHAKGRVLELAGDDAAAAEAYRKSDPGHDRLLDLRRVEARLEKAENSEKAEAPADEATS